MCVFMPSYEFEPKSDLVQVTLSAVGWILNKWINEDVT